MDPDPNPGPPTTRFRPNLGPLARQRRRQRMIIAAVAVFCAVATTAGLILGFGVLSGEQDADTLAAGTAYSGPPVERVGLSDPEGVAIGSDGTLYVTDAGSGYTGQVLALSSQGSLTRFGGSGPLPSGAPTPSPSPSPVLGDGGPATKADLAGPVGIAIGPGHALYVVEKGEERVRRIDRNGTITTYAGVSYSGGGGFTGNNGLASKVDLSSPDGVAVDANGNVYVCEAYRIRKVTPDGMISTIAGTGTSGTEGDGGPAVAATLKDPTGIAVAGDGTVYVADSSAHTIRRILPNGNIERFAGRPNNEYGYTGDGAKAVDAQLYDPTGLAIGPDGSVYVADNGNNAIRKITPDGVITTVAGSPNASDDADGIRATEAKIYSPAGVAVDRTGAIYIAQAGYGTVRRIGTDGILTTVLRAPE
jgi:serine/threonine-protein kinase